MEQDNVIGTSIKMLRKSHQLTQTEMANKLDLSRNYIALIESGKKMPSLKTLKQISILFDVPLASIVSGDPVVEKLRELVEQVGIERITQGLQAIEQLASTKKPA